MPDNPLHKRDETTPEPVQPVRIVSTSWSAVDPGLFDDIARTLLDDWAESLDIERDDLPITLTQAKTVLREFGDAFREARGSFPQFYAEVRDDPEIWTRLTRKVTGADLLPELFWADDVIWENRAELGVAPVISEDPHRAVLAANDINPFVIKKFFDDATGQTVKVPTEDADGNITQVDVDIDEQFKALVGRGLINLRNNLPEVDEFDLSRFTSFDQEEDSEPTGRGSLAFDRAALTQNAAATWGQILWEAPPGGIVDEYIVSANSLWQSSGVQQGFGTWLQGKMQQTSKYGVMYGRMEPGFTELEWQQRFSTAQFGLRLEDERAQSLRGMSSAAAPASFQQSVEQSRDVQSLGQGRFSQRFANHINQLGSLQRI